MKEAIENYLTDFSNALHPDIPADGREVMVRLRRDELMDFSRVVGDIDVSELGPEHIAQYAAALDERGTEKLYRQVKFEQVRDFCTWLVHAKLLKTNPVPSRLCEPWWQRTPVLRQVIGYIGTYIGIRILILVSAVVVLTSIVRFLVWVEQDDHLHIVMTRLFLSAYVALYFVIAILVVGMFYVAGHFIRKYW
jgi:hypothetical protein